MLNESMNYDSLKLKDTLNPKIWDKHGLLNGEVYDALIAVAHDFYKSLNLNIPVEDIIFTGSLANFNWSEYSDVDLHLLLDFDVVYETMKPNDIYDKEEFLKEYFTEKKNSWNKTHNMTIFGHDVEVYVQDKNEDHVSTGVYSVLNKDWIQTPSHVEAKPDLEFIKRKSKHFMDIIDIIVKKNDTKHADKFKEKLKKFRQRGLDADGEMSNSNLIYKVLRRVGYIDKLYDLDAQVFDKENTVQ